MEMKAPSRTEGARGIRYVTDQSVCGTLGLSQHARAGSRTMAPTMFTRNMKVSKMPMSAWNLSGEKIQVATPTARVIAVNTTPVPVILR